MIASRAFALRPSLRAASSCRPHVPTQLTRRLGRRGYASLQDRVAQTSDRPWQIGALAVIILGVIYLRRSGTPKPSYENQVKHAEPTYEPPKTEPKVESSEEPREEEAPEQSATADSSDSPGDSNADASPTSSDSSDAESKVQEGSEESAQEMTGKPASQQEDTTQK
ncbi:hypothetical protein VTK56DRAFT_3 [Thermocarpiscus australiensis]